jgi:hypothetical protein
VTPSQLDELYLKYPLGPAKPLPAGCQENTPVLHSHTARVVIAAEQLFTRSLLVSSPCDFDTGYQWALLHALLCIFFLDSSYY